MAKTLFPILTILVCVGIYYLYISPTAIEVNALASNRAEYTNVLTKVKEVKDKREKELANYNNIQANDIDRLQKIIPSTFDSVSFVNSLNNMAGQYGMIVKDFKTARSVAEYQDAVINPNKNNGYVITPISFQVSGPYPQFIKFLNTLESSLRLIDVVSLNVKAYAPNRPSETSYDYTLEVNTYSLK